MLFKLSLKNIKKSFRDYGIYFFTLIFAIAMFYMFNSMETQNSMLEMNNAKAAMAAVLVELLEYISVFISVVLGFLIIYSNNFIIRKRKKEIGIYLTLGMSKRKVSLIIVVETMVIGILSLAVGLALGIFLSQFISVFTAKMFEVDMAKYSFVFSSEALAKTILYFAIIYVLVMIFNTIVLSKYKLIDLLNAGRKNERVKIRSKFMTFVTFVLAVALIGYAYHLLFGNALLTLNEKTVKMLVCGALGTFLLFYSAAGFLLRIFERMKGIYLKNLNMFTLKQINHKINTTVVSTTVISLLLLLTIGILAGAMAMGNAFNTDLRENNLTDFTLSVAPVAYTYDDNNEITDETPFDMTAFTEAEGFKRAVDNYAVFYIYSGIGLRPEDMMREQDRAQIIKEYGVDTEQLSSVPVISVSDYREIMQLVGEEPIDVKENQYLLLANLKLALDSYGGFYENGGSIKINGEALSPASKRIITTAVENSSSAQNAGILVVPDHIVGVGEDGRIKIVGNYVKTEDVDSLEQAFVDYIEAYETAHQTSGISIRTKLEMEASSVGLKVILIFIGIYLGITFALCSATVLAISQLSEASDNKDRFRVLRQLGADRKMIKRALFTQTAISFGFPLAVAIFHSFFGLRELNSLMAAMGEIHLTKNIAMTSAFIVLVYGGYFLLTYICSKHIIREE